MTPEQEKRLEEIRDSMAMQEVNGSAPRTTVRALLGMVDSLREEVATFSRCNTEIAAKLYGFDATFQAIRAENDGLAKERASLRQGLSNLLANIHRDGGQYQDKHGTEKATADADAVVVSLRQGVERLRSELESASKHNFGSGPTYCENVAKRAERALRETEGLVKPRLPSVGCRGAPCRAQTNSVKDGFCKPCQAVFHKAEGRVKP